VKISEQPELLKNYKNQGTNREACHARMVERFNKAMAKQKRNAAKVTSIKKAKKGRG